MRAINHQIGIPADWRQNWRWNSAWRGLPSRKIGDRSFPTIGLSGKPVVCFTGSLPRSRKVLLREAEQAGWETIDRVRPIVTVMVAGDVNAKSNKLEFARSYGIPILTFEQWTQLTVDGELKDSN
jgi:NAD-dependent DNA ligase